MKSSSIKTTTKQQQQFNCCLTVSCACSLTGRVVPTFLLHLRFGQEPSCYSSDLALACWCGDGTLTSIEWRQPVVHRAVRWWLQIARSAGLFLSHFSHSLPSSAMQSFLPFLKYVFKETLPTSLMGWGLGSGGSILDLAEAGCDMGGQLLVSSHRRHPCSLLSMTKAWPCKPNRPSPADAPQVSQIFLFVWFPFSCHSQSAGSLLQSCACSFLVISY